jgi:hypothetical protein
MSLTYHHRFNFKQLEQCDEAHTVVTHPTPKSVELQSIFEATLFRVEGVPPSPGGQDASDTE